MKPLILHTISTCLLFAASSSAQSSSSSSSSSASPQLNFTSDFDCQPGQFCDYQRKVCTCYDDFQLNPFATSGGIRCSPKRLIAAESSGRCTTTSQCALFAECKNQKCECTFVGARSGSEPWKCARACHTDADCLPYHNFECTEDVGNSSSKSCQCKDGFARGHQGNSCIRVMAPLGGQCNSQLKPMEISESVENRQSASSSRTSNSRQIGCGTYSKCSQKVLNDGPQGRTTVLSTCSCRVGTAPKKDDQYRCEPFSCSTDDDCERHTANSYCERTTSYAGKNDTARCRCVNSFEEDGDRCVLKKEIFALGERCSHEDDCGENAQCHLGSTWLEQKCQCPAGSTARKDGVNCQWNECTKDADCQTLNKDLRCSFKRCTNSKPKSGAAGTLATFSLVSFFSMMPLFFFGKW